MSNEGYHEPIGELSDEVRDMHRAIVSLMEELEAVDWYNQRAAACKDPVLKKILEHNRDEEKEHAAMTLEWLRRNDPTLDHHLRTYLFTDADILEEEHTAEHGEGDAPSSAASTAPSGDGSLGIGSLRSPSSDSGASTQETS